MAFSNNACPACGARFPLVEGQLTYTCEYCEQSFTLSAPAGGEAQVAPTSPEASQADTQKKAATGCALLLVVAILIGALEDEEPDLDSPPPTTQQEQSAPPSFDELGQAAAQAIDLELEANAAASGHAGFETPRVTSLQVLEARPAPGGGWEAVVQFATSSGFAGTRRMLYRDGEASFPDSGR